MEGKRLVEIVAENYWGKPGGVVFDALLAAATQIHNSILEEIDREYQDILDSKQSKIQRLEAEIRELKGLPPQSPIAIA